MIGQLPWQGLLTKSKEEKYRKIKEIKLNTSVDDLTRGFPVEFAEYMNYCRNLEFIQDPDYSYLRRLFKDLYNRCEFQNEHIFDWTIQRYHAQFSWESFAEDLGLKSASNCQSGSSDDSENKSRYAEKCSMENKYSPSEDIEYPSEIENPSKDNLKLNDNRFV